MPAATIFWLLPTLAPGALVLLIALAWQIAVLRRKVRELTDRDPLTGVASRVFFCSALNGAVQQTSASGSVSVAVLDCDDFKQINERFGHSIGDGVLVEVARVLADAVGAAGTVARIWGDAFGIVLPNFSENSARDLLIEVQQRLQAEMSRHNWSLTFSIGISSLGGLIATADALLADTDRLMFEVKRRGRNAIACRGQFHETHAAAGEPSPEFARQP